MHGWYIFNCAKCDCEMAITNRMQENRKLDGGTIYCPNGHTMSYSETEADKLRRQRDRLQQDAARLNDELNEQRKRADAAEVKLSRAKRRANAGVCPCCTRTFANVQRHMKTKHPEVVPIGQFTKKRATP